MDMSLCSGWYLRKMVDGQKPHFDFIRAVAVNYIKEGEKSSSD